MTTKLMDNNRRAHAAKVLAKNSKKNQEIQNPELRPDVEVDQSEKSKGHNLNSLNEQYRIIRDDILKLREDLSHGYDLLKEFIETKISRRTLVKAK